jgi:molecular chaperone DnaK
MLIADARQALKDEAPLARVRELTGELQQAAQALSAARANEPSAAGSSGQSEPGGGSAASADDDDVIDAEFNPA